MYNVLFNNIKYIDGGILRLIDGRLALVLVNANDYSKEFIGINVLSDGQYTYYELPTNIKMELNNINNITQFFAFSRVKSVLGAIMIFTNLLIVGKFVFEHVSPYNSKVVNLAIGNEISLILDEKKHIPNETKINEDLSEEDQKSVSDFLNTINQVFKDYDKPYIDNLNTLDMETLSIEDYFNKELTGFACYDFGKNIVYRQDYSKEGEGEEMRKGIWGQNYRIDQSDHELWHAITNNRENKINRSFELSIDEGVDALVQYEVFGGEDNSMTYPSLQYASRAFQEIIGPRKLMQSVLNDDKNVLLEELAKVYGNELDAVKLINTMDMYCLYYEYDDIEKKNNIDCESMRMDILKQLYLYEKAKILLDIKNNVYNCDNSGMTYFVGKVQYILNINNTMFIFELNSSDQDELDKMRLKFEDEVYEAYTQKYNISLNTLKNIQSYDEYVRFNPKYYYKESKNDFEIIERNLRSDNSYSK